MRPPIFRTCSLLGGVSHAPRIPRRVCRAVKRNALEPAVAHCGTSGALLLSPMRYVAFKVTKPYGSTRKPSLGAGADADGGATVAGNGGGSGDACAKASR